MVCLYCGQNGLQPRVSTNMDEIFRKLRTPGPTRDETSRILLEAEHDLSDCNAEITALENALLIAKQRKQRLQKWMTDYKLLQAPIRQLPSEILGYILLLNCDGNIFDTTPQSTNHLSPAFLYSQVCKMWRDTALNTPAMWSNIAVKLDFSSGIYAEDPDSDSDECVTIVPLGYVMRKMLSVRAALQLCLQRSSQAPLALRLEFGSLDDLGDSGNGIMNDLLSHSYRWRLLSLNLVDSLSESIKTQTYYKVDNQLSMIRDLPLLEHFGTKPHMIAKLQKFMPVIQQASHLHSVRLDLGEKPMEIDEEVLQTIQWAQLSNLELIGAVHSDMVKILSRCSHLSTLSLEKSYTDGVAHFPAFQSITLERIHTLRLLPFTSSTSNSETASKFTTSLKGIFSSLTLPALKRLVISGDTSTAPRTSSRQPNWGVSLNSAETKWPHKIFSEFMIRSRCSLSFLSLDQVPITDSEALSILRLMPTLTSLDIRERPIPISGPRNHEAGVIVTDRFLKNLHILIPELGFGNGNEDGQGHSLLPQLRNLELRAIGAHFSIDEFAEMVISRWLPNPSYSAQIGVGCIRMVKLVIMGRGEESSVERTRAYASMMQLESSGLQVEIDWDCA
ncbi:hypothetical protein VKT23_015926 [Stygiomarasmius scandens]|uniref:F-box domain-containing protein n=1 Tax=Marasmiellus scandens TaxID=2682957 RepID=A0ABR1IYM6_9AGAR